MLSPPEDVEMLLERLQASAVAKHREFKGLGHLDFTWGVEAFATVYPEVLAALE